MLRVPISLMSTRSASLYRLWKITFSHVWSSPIGEPQTQEKYITPIRSKMVYIYRLTSNRTACPAHVSRLNFSPWRYYSSYLRIYGAWTNLVLIGVYTKCQVLTSRDEIFGNEPCFTLNIVVSRKEDVLYLLDNVFINKSCFVLEIVVPRIADGVEIVAPRIEDVVFYSRCDNFLHEAWFTSENFVSRSQVYPIRYEDDRIFGFM